MVLPTGHRPIQLRVSPLSLQLVHAVHNTTRKHAKIAPIRRAYNVVADNTGLSSFV